jgi:hypothetical protein
MLKHLRLWLPIAGLTALVASGCLFLSGQFVVTYNFADHGYDPLTMNSSIAVIGVPVDLNLISTYKDHKQDLKDVSDLAVVGTVTNLDNAAPVDVEIWIVPTSGTLLTTDAAVRSAGVRVWGPLSVGAGASRSVGWDDSARLFVGRDALIREVKGDGRFDLYALGSGGYHFRISKAAIIAVIGAGK